MPVHPILIKLYHYLHWTLQRLILRGKEGGQLDTLNKQLNALRTHLISIEVVATAREAITNCEMRKLNYTNHTNVRVTRSVLSHLLLY